MDRFFYDEVEAALEHPDLNVFFWGVNFTGWNSALSSTENVQQQFPDVRFDIVYSMNQNWGLHIPSAVSVLTIGDCHHPNKCTSSLEPYDDIVALRYAGELIDLFRYDQWKSYTHSKAMELKRQGDIDAYYYILSRKMPFFFHHTDCANENVFYPSKFTEDWQESRPIPAQLYGFTWDILYPLRHTVKEGITHGKIFNAVAYKHPGYDLESDEDLPPPISERNGKYDSQDARVGHLRKQQQSYAQSMRETQICIFDSSVLKKAIRKFHEAFLSGCVVASDIPIEMESMFRDVVIPLRLDMTAHEVNSVLEDYLSRPERLAWMAREAFYRARQHWTCRNKVDRLLEASERVLKGEKGYWFPFGFSATCRKYPFAPDKNSEWCT
ncbi:hypothetical protein BCR33DRAFT_741292 [Rhizoclosmatium globosum]|uniref:Glycosyl transferase CAP10 domain-containing protein n=1 Tax=Rhizoclosmatium globosum TaxID=329046 RepID=A0A1Y2BVT5_9FUNG|nr:hypothetical protein BCR33DRAFT_741292 [Rhizoclosmatium globosum]|eukprot:ORY38784.1 hypothetical protein BCR33DRAFT_741292 [Rhizoclosmatium globosum]